MMRLANLIAATILATAPGIAVGQGSIAAPHPAGAVERKPLAKANACANVAYWINGVLRSRPATDTGNATLATLPREIAAGHVPAGELDCGAMPGLTPGISLELTKVFYDRMLHSWEFLVRCVTPANCVPFLVRWSHASGQARRDGPQLSSSTSHDRVPESQHVMLRPGETATLVWDQDGIRVVLPVICLDRGNVGDSIRVRIKSGSRVLRAEILNESLLRAIL
jgi:hypothetical protein